MTITEMLGAQVSAKLDDIMRRSYERGDQQPNVELLQQLESPLTQEQIETAAAMQVDVVRAMSGLGERHQLEALVALSQALAFELCVRHGLPASALIKLVSAAGQSAEQYVTERNQRFAAGQFSSDVEHREISKIHQHLGGANGGQTAAQLKPSTFRVPSDGKVH